MGAGYAHRHKDSLLKWKRSSYTRKESLHEWEGVRIFICWLIYWLNKILRPLSCKFLFILEWTVVVSLEDLKIRQKKIKRNSEDTRPD